MTSVSITTNRNTVTIDENNSSVITVSTQGPQGPSGSSTLDDGSVAETKLDIHADPSGTNKFLGYTANGMEWAVPPDTNTEYSVGDNGLTKNNFTDALKTKLDSVESNSTADQTGAEIKTAYEAESDTNAFTDALKTKLDGIETSATADQTGAEIKAAYEGESDTNAFTDTEKTKLSGIATSANNYVHPNHSGEVTSSADGATVIASNIVDEDNLKISNSPSNGTFLQYKDGTDELTWATPTDTNTTYTAGTGLNLSGTEFSVTAIALTTVQEAANESAQLSLTTQEGDVVVRTDENKTYVKNAGTAGTMADFTLLRTPTDAVLSVNGNTGAITAAQIAGAVEAASDSNTFTDADHTKLNGIEASATADQTGAEIKTAYEAESDTNAYTDAEKTKLAGIETSATADQTDAEIRAAVEAASDSNVFTDADHTKLNGIEASATADQTGAEIKTAYEAESDTNAFTDSEKTKLSGIATGATNTAAPYYTSAISVGDGGLTQNNFTNADHTKLNGIEASADVTDATNVDAAGAVMNSDLDGKGELLVGDGSGDPTALAVGTNNYVLTADSNEATGVKWAAAGAGGDANQNAFSNFAVSGQDTVAADSTTDTVTFVGGTNVTITTNATNDEITFTSTDTQYSVGDNGLTKNNFTDALKTKLDGIATGAEVNVQSDWNSSSGDSQILNKPTIPTNNNELTNGAGYTTNAGTVTSVTGTSPIASSGGTTPAISISAATTSAAGSMSSADKTKLDGIAASANNYVHPNHSGDVTSSADGATTIADNAVTLAKMAGLARGKIIYGDSSGDPAALAPGSANQVLTSDGTDISWAAASSGGISNLVEDTSPQLGGNLDIQTHNISGTGTITATSVAHDATGMRKITASTSSPSGGASGDIWVKYTA